MKTGLITLALAASALTTTAASATDFINQLPPGGSDVSYAWASQYFESDYSAFNVALIDDFTVGSAATVTSVSAVIYGFNGWSSTSSIQNYSVEFYSSAAAAASNLTGDIGSFNFAPGSASITNPYAQTNAALVTFSLSQALTSGTYWLGVIPRNDFNGSGQTAISSGGPGNAVQVNPNGGFGFSGGLAQRSDAAYYAVSGSLAGVPEPAAWSLMLVGFGAIGAGVRRRRVTVTYA